MADNNQNKAIVSYQNKLPARLLTSTNFINGLKSEELEMLRVKYDGKRIMALGPGAVELGAEILLADSGIITGWTVPDHALYKKKLLTEIVAWLQDMADDFTFAEIKYALRKYCGEVKDYGKPVNLSLLNNIIKMYRGDREELSRREEFANPPKQRIFDHEDYKNFAREDAQICFAWFLKGVMVGSHEDHEQILREDGLLLQDELVTNMFKRRMEKGITAIYQFVKNK